MCGRFSTTAEREALEARFGARFDAAWFQARYNAAPAQALPVILNTAPQRIQPALWGLKPAWARAIGKKDGIINVRAETLRDRVTFQRDLAERRCLVLNRMPAVLKPEEERVWLAGDVPCGKLLSLLRPYPAELMDAYRISTKVNRASVDQLDLIEPERERSDPILCVVPVSLRDN